jgi:hypothetical protein
MPVTVRHTLEVTVGRPGRSIPGSYVAEISVAGIDARGRVVTAASGVYLGRIP